MKSIEGKIAAMMAMAAMMDTPVIRKAIGGYSKAPLTEKQKHNRAKAKAAKKARKRN